MAKRLWLWAGWIRVPAFLAVVVGLLTVLDVAHTPFDLGLIVATMRRAFGGDIAGVSTQAFAFSLAFFLVFLAGALAIAFLVLDVVPVCWSIARVRRQIEATPDHATFAGGRGALSDRLERHPLIGHAWRQFEATWVEDEDDRGAVQSTARPQGYLNIGVARDRLFGLKMMNSVPGYFVGVGLLLTFIGLVLALYKAAAAVSSSDAGGMQVATRELLQVATFKFSTSIAGLGASILLSILFRVYTVAIEGSFGRLCHAVEARLRYVPPQTFSARMTRTLDGQLAELKAITSGDFFARMGQELGPQIQAAFQSAVQPMAESIDAAVGRMAENSQSGMSDLISQFTDGVQNGAGSELRELTGTLQTLQASLAGAQAGMNASSEDFGRRMGDAADGLQRLIAEAGQRLGDSSERSRAALADVVDQLRQSFDQARRTVDDGVTQAATGVSDRVEEVMGRVLGRLEEQVGAFGTGLGGFQEGMAAQIDRNAEVVAAVQRNAVDAIGAVTGEMAEVMKRGLLGAMQGITAEVERFSGVMHATQESLVVQIGSVRDSTSQMRGVSDAFTKTAQDVRTASAPLLQSGERIARATESLERSMGTSVSALGSSQQEAGRLAARLGEQATRMSELWGGYATRFDRIDQELARAVTDLAKATQSQGENLTQHAGNVDKAFASATDKLRLFLAEFNDNAEEFGEAVDKLKDVLTRRAA